MNELITKQAMKDMIINHRSDFSNEINYRTALACVDAVLPAQSELPWVPVEQGLPKIGEYVLCETTARYFGKYHVCKFVDKDKWIDKPHFDWDSNGFPHVIAWTRFEPYKGEME